jgi:hypothetical protein
MVPNLIQIMGVCNLSVFVLSCVVEALQWADPLSKKYCKLNVQYFIVGLTLKWVQARGPNPTNEEEN